MRIDGLITSSDEYWTFMAAVALAQEKGDLEPRKMLGHKPNIMSVRRFTP